MAVGADFQVEATAEAASAASVVEALVEVVPVEVGKPPAPTILKPVLSRRYTFSTYQLPVAYHQEVLSRRIIFYLLQDE